MKIVFYHMIFLPHSAHRGFHIEHIVLMHSGNSSYYDLLWKPLCDLLWKQLCALCGKKKTKW